MSKKIIGIIILSLLGSSCSIPAGVSNIQPKQSPTSTLLKENSYFDPKITLEGTGKEGKDINGTKNNDKAKEESMEIKNIIPDSISNLKSIDDLKKFSSSLSSLSGSDHKDFVEFQKNQLIIGIYLSKITDPTFIKIYKEELDIIQGKEIWSQELKQLNSELLELQSKRLDKSNFEKIGKAIDNFNRALIEFMHSGVYKNYIQKEQSKLDDLDNAMKPYLSQEIIKLRSKVKVMNAELSKTGR